MAALNPWTFLPFGYLLTISVEVPVLYFGLARHHSAAARVFAGLWLTACTYPLVILAFPDITERWYVAAAETFAPAAECLLFAWVSESSWQWRDMAAIAGANLMSFVAGAMLWGV